MNLSLDMFVERAAPGSVRGDHWRVSWFDRELSKFVGGSGPNAWIALAWACVNRIETARGLVVLARNATDTPEERLKFLTYGIAPASPPLTSVARSSDRAESGSFPEPSSPTGTRPDVAFSLTTEQPPPKSVAARRAATKKQRTKQ